jgi:hypothetical protein
MSVLSMGLDLKEPGTQTLEIINNPTDQRLAFNLQLVDGPTLVFAAMAASIRSLRQSGSPDVSRIQVKPHPSNPATVHEF